MPAITYRGNVSIPAYREMISTQMSSLFWVQSRKFISASSNFSIRLSNISYPLLGLLDGAAESLQETFLFQWSTDLMCR